MHHQAVLFEKPLQRHPGGLRVVDDQGTLEGHGVMLWQFSPGVQTCPVGTAAAGLLAEAPSVA
jgi:hypothetical protein